ENGLIVTAGGGVTIRGLAVTGFPDEGIDLAATGDGGNFVQGNIVGLLPDGTTIAANGGDGIGVFTANNLIGGTVPAHRNVSSGNANAGITIANDTATGNLVQGNLIGTDASGTMARPNSTAGNLVGGLLILNASGNTIGGPAPGDRNVISGNREFGVQIFAAEGLTASNNSIGGNYIGVDVTGENLLENEQVGALIASASNNRIGGPSDAERNIIDDGNESAVSITFSFNNTNPSDGNIIEKNYTGVGPSGSQVSDVQQGVGIFLSGSSNTQIEFNTIANQGIGIDVNAFFGLNSRAEIFDNFIGTDSTGALPIGNSSHGVRISGPHDDNSIEDNVIVASNNGIRVENGATDLFIGGNRLGLPASGPGNATFGNVSGVVLIGSGYDLRRNEIANNSNDGIRVQGEDSDRNRFTQNSIFANGSLGIELGDSNGVTENDVGDNDTGPNQELNFPVIISAAGGIDTLVIEGTIDSVPVDVEFYANDQCDPSGNGEGQNYIGEDRLTSGNFTTMLPVAIAEGQFITAIAIDDEGNTSEFSDCILATSAEVIFRDRFEL
ncbi:MAG: NosD domain-containing protein, partial [Wenzhouxiangella sp.]|nr:NosD domain-containing protein [Wenzhouxiangella sp.]